MNKNIERIPDIFGLKSSVIQKTLFQTEHATSIVAPVRLNRCSGVAVAHQFMARIIGRESKTKDKMGATTQASSVSGPLRKGGHKEEAIKRRL